MKLQIDTENIGVPDIELAGLNIWTHSRKYPDHQDFWDGNWLETTVLCKTDNAAVWLNAHFLRNTEIKDWLEAIEILNETFSGEAILNPIEKPFSIKISPESYQRISIRVVIFPKINSHQHHFEFWLMRESLNELIKSCRKILEKFPIRGKK